MTALGFKVRPDAGGYVVDAPDLQAAAALVAELYPAPARVKACTSLTRDRELTSDELAELAQLAAGLIVAAPA